MDKSRGHINRLCLPTLRVPAWRCGALLVAVIWAGASVANAGGQIPSMAHSVAAGNANGWSAAAPMSTARDYLAAARGPNGTIYAIGGYDVRGRVLRTVEAYDPRTNTWSARAPMPAARGSLAAATGSNGTIYVVGGLDGRRHPLNTVEAYDPRFNTWSRRAPMPTARGDLAAVAGRDGKIYAIGGWKGTGPSLGTVEAYNPATNTWSKRASLPLPSLPFPTHDLAATLGPDGKIYALAWGDAQVYDPSTNTWSDRASSPAALDEVIALAAVIGSDGRMYGIGGHRSPKEHRPATEPYVVNTVVTYRPDAVAWTIGPPMPTARYGLAAVAGSDGNIYVLGGRGRQNQTLRTVEVYNPKRDPWTTVASLPKVTDISRNKDIGISSAAARGLDGKIYALLGGVDHNGNATTVVQAYDPKTNTWMTRAALPTPVNFMPAGLFGAVAGRDGKIYVVGGDKGDKVEAYDPRLNRWSAKAPIPIQLYALTVAAGLDGKIYAIGYRTLSKPTVEVYDPATNTWTGRAPLPTRGFTPLAAATGPDGKIYVFGRQTVPDYARAVAIYDPRADSWTTREPVPNLGGVQAAVTGSDGKIYVVGGAISYVAPLAAYDPRLDRWSIQAPVPMSRYNLAAAGSNGKIYVLGGANHDSGVTVHEVDVFTIAQSAAGH